MIIAMENLKFIWVVEWMDSNQEYRTKFKLFLYEKTAELYKKKLHKNKNNIGIEIYEKLLHKD